MPTLPCCLALAAGLLLGCATEDEAPFVSSRKDAATDADPIGGALDGPLQLVDSGQLPPPTSGSHYVLVADLGEPDIIETVRSGADIDAVGANCGVSGIKYPVDITDGRTGEAATTPVEAALGAPDCEEAGECSASLGVRGHLIFQMEQDLRGCTVTVYEVLDAEEPYEVYVCPRAEWVDCIGPIEISETGGELEVMVP